MSEKKTPVKTVSLMMVITLLGKLLGLLRDRCLSVNYGSGMEASAFLAASRIPRVFFDAVFASAISASFIPVFGEALEKRGRDQAMKFAGNFITVMGLLCALLTGAGIVFAEPLCRFFADGFDAGTLALCVKLARVMMPTVFFTGVAFSFVGVLQCLDEFNVPAAISLVSNAAVILYYYTLNGRFGVEGLAITFLFAWFLQGAVQVPALRRKGFRYTPSLALRSEGMRKVFRLMLPVMVSTWVLPLNQLINAKFASRLFEGAGTAALEYAYNLYTVITGVFILSVTNYIFPRLTRENAGGDSEALRKTVSGTVHTALFVVVPMTVGLFLCAEPLVAFIYGGGAFDGSSVAITSRALRFLTLGMAGYAVQAVLSRVYFAEQNGTAPLVAGAVSIALNVALCELLTGPLDVAGVAVASAAAFTVNGVLLYVPLRKRDLQFLDRQFVTDLLKILASALVMGAAVWGLRELLSGRVGKLLTLFLPAGAGVIVYAAAVVLLRVPEAKMAVDTLKNMRKGGSGRA